MCGLLFADVTGVHSAREEELQEVSIDLGREPGAGEARCAVRHSAERHELGSGWSSVWGSASPLTVISAETPFWWIIGRYHGRDRSGTRRKRL